jgi:hypothetical protein
MWCKDALSNVRLNKWDCDVYSEGNLGVGRNNYAEVSGEPATTEKLSKSSTNELSTTTRLLSESSTTGFSSSSATSGVLVEYGAFGAAAMYELGVLFRTTPGDLHVHSLLRII